MVLLHVKRGDESLFLLEADVGARVADVLRRVVDLQNARLKVLRLCMAMEQLAEHGPSLPPEMHGLTDEQIEELGLEDEWAEKCVPSGGHTENRDPLSRRCGRQPSEKMRGVLLDTVREARGLVSKELIKGGTPLTPNHTQDALTILSGAVTIVYPMNLPPHDPIREELENREDLSGTQDGKMVLDPGRTHLWFASKELMCDKKLRDYIGTNNKTKVIIKVQVGGGGPPAREPIMTEEQRRNLMAAEFRRREELKKLEEDTEDSYLDSSWADPNHLHRSFQGLTNISWKPH